MEKYEEFTGKTIDLAVEAGLKKLNMDRDSVSVEVLENAKSGFLGIFGVAPAKVRLTWEVPDEEEKPVVKPALSSASRSYTPPKKKTAEKPAAAPAEEAPEKKPVQKAAAAGPAAAPAEKPAAEKAAEQAPRQKSGSGKQTSGGKSGGNRQQHSGDGQKKRSTPRQEGSGQQPKPAAPAAQQAAEPKVWPVAAPGSTEEKVETFLKGLLEHMGSDAVPHAVMQENGTCQVELTGQHMGMLIGRRGETLDAIQHITNYAVNRGSSKRIRIYVDAEGYRQKREESLERLAVKVAGKVVRFRRNMTLEPMNAYERHVIHATLQDYPDVTTYSTGTEPNRRVVVAYSRYRSTAAAADTQEAAAADEAAEESE